MKSLKVAKFTPCHPSMSSSHSADCPCKFIPDWVSVNGALSYQFLDIFSHPSLKDYAVLDYEVASLRSAHQRLARSTECHGCPKSIDWSFSAYGKYVVLSYPIIDN